MMGNFPLTVWRLQVQGQGVFKGCSPYPRLASDGGLRLPWAFQQLPPTFRGLLSLSVSPSLCPNFLFYTDTVTLDEGPPE